MAFYKAFLCIEPNFALWLKIFCVKMQTSNNKPTECGVVMISKILGAKWLEGKFINTVKHWQEEWFYMPDVPLANSARYRIATAFTAMPQRGSSPGTPRTSLGRRRRRRKGSWREWATSLRGVSL